MSPTLLLALCLSAPPEVPQPEPTRPDEPMAAAFSPAKAAEYLDGVGVNWTRDRQCITCHTNLPYMLARPLLPGDAGWKEVRKFLEDDVAKWENGGKPRGDAYVVATAFALAFSDAKTTGRLHPMTKAALDRMWKGQKPSGEWNWLKCDWPPMEHDDYYGATVAALAAGVAPGDYAKTDAAKAGIEKLQVYFKKTPAPDLHHKAMLLWASTVTDGLLSAEEQKKVVTELKAKQHADGGWGLPSLGEYKRRDKTDNDPNAPSDGYGTGFVVYVLRQSGVPADDPAVKKGVVWLKANQRASGRWYTRSLNNDKAHYITNAGTAFCMLALDACGEMK
ncbi:MAG TPA: prenyltransferase/squalene oxidase repeat-containing protein [Gemmataceae bacterium]|nr:prenyltransferase/squalene oxidase repeat-containing protein [Gemmataceae bacterium]